MKTFISIFLSIIFIPLLVILVLYYSLSSSIINQKNLPDTLAKYNAYSTVTDKILPEMLDNIFSNGATTEQKNTIESTIQKIKTSITPQWLEENFSKSYDKIISHIKGDPDTSKMEIDIGVISKIFTPQEIATSFISSDDLKKQFEELPICDQSQKNNCKQEDLTFEDYQKMLSTSMEENGNSTESGFTIPEKINLYDLLNSKNNISDNLKNLYSLSNSVFFISIGLEILLILILVIIHFNEPKKMFKYLGYNFMISAIILLVTSLIPLSSNTFFTHLLPTTLIPNIYASDLISIVAIIIKSLFSKILIISIVLVIISIVFFVLSKKIKPSIEINNINIQ